MTDRPVKLNIDLNPYSVKDETVSALKREIMEQSDIDADDIVILDTVVLDSTEDGGLDSHAEVFVESDGGGDADE